MTKKISIGMLCIWLFSSVAIFFLFETETSQAIPAFGRKYRMSCTTCHAPFPKLKDYGDEFAGNGFVLKDKDAPRYTMETGDEKLDLIREFPIAVRLEGFIKYLSETDRNADLSTPYNLKLLSGGAITKDVAYYFYFYLSERGEVAGVEDAYIMFNNLFNSELDFYFGQFQISDPLFKRELRLSYEDYPVYTVKPGISNINLAYDRGIMLTYGFETGTDIIGEIINGNGIGEADDFRVFDDDKYKCFVGRISQDIGEYFRIGGFAYYGKEGNEITNEVKYYGPDFSFVYGPIELNMQYLERRDSDPAFEELQGDDIETRGTMAEVILMPYGDRSEWYALALHNWIESDITDLNYNTLTGHLGYVFRTNIRMYGEFTYDIEHEESRAVMGIVTAF